jgi:predicted transposase YbfD/YdcC
MVAELKSEIVKDGSVALRDHLHMCGAIPEDYGHDSSEEKLYSKYTDVLLSLAFAHIGVKSIVLTERADAADVEGVASNYSFVADAKAFRLSRTAKNQKDFKVQAMDGWKRGKPYAIVVCPMYQLPASKSQIYQQAIARDVCILTYSHLALLVSLADSGKPADSSTALGEILGCVSALNPTKDAVQYWTRVNQVMLSFHGGIRALWKDEKMASLESVAAAKEEALSILSRERERIMRMTKDEAIIELIKRNNIDGRIRAVAGVRDNGILDLT